MRPQLVYDVACPWCGAGFDEACRTLTVHKRPGRPRPTPHEARRTAFRVARATDDQDRENAGRLAADETSALCGNSDANEWRSTGPAA